MISINEARVITEEATIKRAEKEIAAAEEWIEQVVSEKIRAEAEAGVCSAKLPINGLTVKSQNWAIDKIKEAGYDVTCGKNNIITIYW